MIRTYDLKVPPLPRKRPAWLASTRAWWASVWHSPMAAEYLDVDRFALERLARLIDEGGRRPLKVGELAAIVSLEDRFGLTPRSRRMLGWAVLDAADVATREPPVVGRGSNVRRLRAVDPGDAGA